ncbi:hypothetical protein N9K06_00345 [Omnitrophica bacterium]|nr:hypothetical protein [Candidatus Omnitrophota bacterium]
MTIFIGLCAFMAGGFGAWHLTRKFQDSRLEGRVHDLESRLRYTQQESAKLKETLAVQRGESSALKNTLQQERTHHANRYLKLGVGFRNALLFTTFGTFFMTSAVVGGLAWFTSSIWNESRVSRVIAEAETSALFYQTKVSELQAALTFKQSELSDLKTRLVDQQVEKEVAVTKLQILLDSLSFQGGVQGFTIDYQKLRDNLKSNIEGQSLPKHFTGMKSAVMQP